jgi:hypothetical protein
VLSIFSDISIYLHVFHFSATNPTNSKSPFKTPTQHQRRSGNSSSNQTQTTSQHSESEEIQTTDFVDSPDRPSPERPSPSYPFWYETEWKEHLNHHSSLPDEDKEDGYGSLRRFLVNKDGKEVSEETYKQINKRVKDLIGKHILDKKKKIASFRIMPVDIRDALYNGLENFEPVRLCHDHYKAKLLFRQYYNNLPKKIRKEIESAQPKEEDPEVTFIAKARKGQTPVMDQDKGKGRMKLQACHGSLLP